MINLWWIVWIILVEIVFVISALINKNEIRKDRVVLIFYKILSCIIAGFITMILYIINSAVIESGQTYFELSIEFLKVIGWFILIIICIILFFLVNFWLGSKIANKKKKTLSKSRGKVK